LEYHTHTGSNVGFRIILMKIREKLILGFGIYIALAASFGFSAYKELQTITTSLALIERTDDLTNLLLEMRRYEKNYLLYRDKENLQELKRYIAEFSRNAENIRGEIVTHIGADKLHLMNKDIRDYNELVEALAVSETNEVVESMRQKARDMQSITKNLSMKEREVLNGKIGTSLKLLLYAMVIIIIAGAIVNYKLAVSIERPIKKIKDSAKRMALGDLSEEIDIRGNDEIASLGRSLNSMQIILQHVLRSLESTVSELREKQFLLIRSEKLASIGVFASGIAHEISNPLTSVLTFSNLMLEKMPEDDPRREMLKIMSFETVKARNIVRQLLTFAKDATINPSNFNMNRQISEMINALKLQGVLIGIEVKLTLSSDPDEVYGDPVQIGQVITNMLMNAIQAISPPGTITISTHRTGDELEISLSDTGCGIPAEYIDKIFDPFFSTKGTKGTGLGLAVSYDIIKKHGGDIEVTSKDGGGTTFIIWLPIHGQDQGNSR
jgi:two-component system NtrC family sensor kinase